MIFAHFRGLGKKIFTNFLNTKVGNPKINLNYTRCLNEPKMPCFAQIILEGRGVTIFQLFGLICICNFQVSKGLSYLPLFCPHSVSPDYNFIFCVCVYYDTAQNYIFIICLIGNHINLV